MTNEEVQQEEKWLVCVVVLEKKKPRTYANFYLGVKGDRDTAVVMQNEIAKRGFKAGDRRYWPDEIETLTLKQVSGDTEDEQ